MKFFHGGNWWFPDHEQHLQEWILTMRQQVPGDRLGYQVHKYKKALEHVKQRRTAVDIGGHVGLWSWPMSHDFDLVIAFEPMPEHIECWEKNMEGIDNAVCLQTALGNQKGSAFCFTRTPDSSGDTGISLTGDGIEVQMSTLDSYEMNDVDFIKVDCEGYELFILQGAEETLLRNKPCVIVEQKPETGMEDRYSIGTLDAVRYLESLGAKLRCGIQGDYILSWDY